MISAKRVFLLKPLLAIATVFSLALSALSGPASSTAPVARVSHIACETKQTFVSPRLRSVAALLRRVPAYATLRQIKAILPLGTRYQTVAMEPMGDWKWNTIRFDGKYHGVLVFANDRRKYRTSEAEKTKVAMLRENDQVHSVEVFLGPESLDDNDAKIQRVTRKRLNEAIRVLGKPTQSATQRYGDGPGPEGWNATWKLPHAHELYLAQDYTYGADGVHPFLMLTFGYSHLYRE